MLRTRTNDAPKLLLIREKARKSPAVTETITQTTAAPSVDTFVRTLNDPRYQLIEKKDNKEVYRDRTTGTRWVVKVEREEE